MVENLLRQRLVTQLGHGTTASSRVFIGYMLVSISGISPCMDHAMGRRYVRRQCEEYCRSLARLSLPVCSQANVSRSAHGFEGSQPRRSRRYKLASALQKMLRRFSFLPRHIARAKSKTDLPCLPSTPSHARRKAMQRSTQTSQATTWKPRAKALARSTTPLPRQTL